MLTIVARDKCRRDPIRQFLAGLRQPITDEQEFAGRMILKTRGRMTLCRTAAVPAVLTFLGLCSGCRSILELEPERPATIRVGDVAAVRVDTARHYTVGSAGDSLTLIKRAEEHGTTAYVYRAVAPGHQTFVLTPRDAGPDGCISCVTVHYFITIVR